MHNNNELMSPELESHNFAPGPTYGAEIPFGAVYDNPIASENVREKHIVEDVNKNSVIYDNPKNMVQPAYRGNNCFPISCLWFSDVFRGYRERPMA